MNLTNKEGNDLSPEGYIQLALCLEMVYAMQIMGYRMSNALDSIGARGNFFQKKKMAFNKARTQFDSFLKNLDVAFDGIFDDIFFREGNAGERSDELQKLANDVIRILLVWSSRLDGTDEKRKKLEKALLNFKQTSSFDLPAMFKFYNFKLD